MQWYLHNGINFFVINDKSRTKEGEDLVENLKRKREDFYKNINYCTEKILVLEWSHACQENNFSLKYLK